MDALAGRYTDTVMLAAVYERYGAPEAVHLQQVPVPTPGDNAILVRVDATTVNLVDCAFRSGKPFAARLYAGLFRPRMGILGSELAGRVAAVGRNVTRFAVNDLVFGSTDTFGAHAEYVCIKAEGVVAEVPPDLALPEAAAAAGGGLTALPFLRDHANLQPGQRIAIVGAAGSIGTAAVQLAKHFGAHVTAICSEPNHALVRSLGADTTIDYRTEDFTRRNANYDVVFDTVGKSSFSACRRILSDRGLYMTTTPSLRVLLQMAWTRLRGGPRAIFAATGARSTTARRQDLLHLRNLITTGNLRIVVDQQMPLQQIRKAHRLVDTGHKRANLVITVPHPYASRVEEGDVAGGGGGLVVADGV